MPEEVVSSYEKRKQIFNKFRDVPIPSEIYLSFSTHAERRATERLGIMPEDLKDKLNSLGEWLIKKNNFTFSYILFNPASEIFLVASREDDASFIIITMERRRSLGYGKTVKPIFVDENIGNLKRN